jgi:hypothetical protein
MSGKVRPRALNDRSNNSLAVILVSVVSLGGNRVIGEVGRYYDVPFRFEDKPGVGQMLNRLF